MGDLTDGAGGQGRGTGKGTLFRVDGRVQRVGFRAFVVRRADALRLDGWTCNLADGAVGVAAAGPDGAVAEFAAALRAGPPGASVSRVRAIGSVPVRPGMGFAVVGRPPAPAGDLLDAAGAQLGGQPAVADAADAT